MTTLATLMALWLGLTAPSVSPVAPAPAAGTVAGALPVAPQVAGLP